MCARSTTEATATTLPILLITLTASATRSSASLYETPCFLRHASRRARSCACTGVLAAHLGPSLAMLMSPTANLASELRNQLSGTSLVDLQRQLRQNTPQTPTSPLLATGTELASAPRA